MTCSKIFISLESLENFDLNALNDYNIENNITDCVFIVSNTTGIEMVSNLNANTNILVRNRDAIDVNVVMLATEDANISTCEEMTFTDERIYLAMKPYLGKLGIKTHLLEYKSQEPKKTVKKGNLSVSDRKKLTSLVIKKFKAHEPVGDSIQYCTLCSKGFSDELKIKSFGYKKLIDLIEDLNYFDIERFPSNIVIKFPPKK